MNAKEMADYINDNPEFWTEGMRTDDRLLLIRALRLLAAAEANGGERSQLIEELRTEADLCRNETADDVADLLDDAASSLVAISAMANALKDERDAFKRHAEEVKRDLAASVVKSAGLEEENSKLRSALAIVHFKREPWQ